MLELSLYGTLGCHLCEVAEQMLAASLDFSRVQVELVDIADNSAGDSDQLMERYAIRIPVLVHPASGKELGWPFAPEQLAAWISSLTD